MSLPFGLILFFTLLENQNELKNEKKKNYVKNKYVVEKNFDWFFFFIHGMEKKSLLNFFWKKTFEKQVCVELR